MHKTDFAPVLSATSNRDSVWIISNIPNLHWRFLLGFQPKEPISLGPVIHAANHSQRFNLGQIYPAFLAEPQIMP
jgi:hypothetical protein